MKKKCAKEALRYIKNNTIIGLGGGSTISYLISFIKEAGLNIEVVTPSFKTASLCIENGLKVIPTWSVSKISVAFDGCDEVDENLTALKSGGGIHTNEKIIATMADDYILLVDSDDFLKKEMVEKMLLKAKESQSDIVISNYCLYYKENKVYKALSDMPKVITYSSFQVIDMMLKYKLQGQLWNKLFKYSLEVLNIAPLENTILNKVLQYLENTLKLKS